MDYKKIYYSLIEKRKNKDFDGYGEIHHIQPKCLGGSNLESNLVKLTAREHFIAHLLLKEIYPKNIGLSYAAFAMSHYGKDKKYKVSARTYDRLKREYWTKERKTALASRNKMEEYKLYGEDNPSKRPEVRLKISKKTSGKANGMYGKSGDKNPFFGKKHSPEFLEHKKILHGIPLYFKGVEYCSLREAMRKTGVSRYLIKKHKTFKYKEL